MKIILVIFLNLFSLISEAQVSGHILDNEKKQVPYATVFNLKTKTGCQADTNGFFSINASINDSIRIQHLGYKMGNFIVKQNPDMYILNQKVYDLQEIVLSNAFPMWLYFKSYEKTIAKFKYNGRDRFYCNATKLVNGDTLQKYFLDLDFEQNKIENSTDVVIHNRFIEVQRYTQQIKAGLDPNAKYNMNINIFPKLNIPCLTKAQNINNALNNDYVYIMTTDSQFIYVNFIPRKKAPTYYNAWEATIKKSDTCLVSFAVISSSNEAMNWKPQENKPDLTEQALYYKISYSNSIGYISEIYSRKIFHYTINNKKYINSYILNLKNYAHDNEKLKKRFGIYCLNNDIVFNEKQKTMGSKEFWNMEDFPWKAPYDFEQLRKLKQQIKTQ
ncbi:MAG: carboxypeptidase-like regulatory domain-containing protein [Bacteroidia bacterium]|nr:carboxypeptidase-like regulatory domain-containing protein [Bacteroidia bacterium]